MNLRAFVAGETDETNFAGLLRLQYGLHRSAFCKNTVRIAVANHFMKLEKINPIGLEAYQGVMELAQGRRFRAPVDLRHEKSLLTITIAYGLAHADFTFATVVVPAVAEKIYAFIKTRADDANAFLRVRLFAKMITAESDDLDSLFSAA